MSTDQQMQPEIVTESGAPAAQQQIVEYWGTDDRRKWFFPDGVQYMEFKVMDEGARAKFQRQTNQDMTINRDQTAKVRMDPATERQSLIKSSVCDWHLYKEGKPTSYDNGKMEKWLSVADPKLVDSLEFEIRMANPWLQAEMSLVEIDKELDRLTEVRKQVVEREAGEGSSTRK